MCLYDTTMTYIMRHLIEYNYAAGSVVDRTVILGEYLRKADTVPSTLMFSSSN
jgi:hypothetical protein